MKTFTDRQVDKLFRSCGGDFQRDNSGQVIIYTGMFEWNDGTFRDEPEPVVSCGVDGCCGCCNTL
jgi:hypothetical protein